jgi:hypothetical protein
MELHRKFLLAIIGCGVSLCQSERMHSELVDVFASASFLLATHTQAPFFAKGRIFCPSRDEEVHTNIAG